MKNLKCKVHPITGGINPPYFRHDVWCEINGMLALYVVVKKCPTIRLTVIETQCTSVADRDTWRDRQTDRQTDGQTERLQYK